MGKVDDEAQDLRDQIRRERLAADRLRGALQAEAAKLSLLVDSLLPLLPEER